MTASLIRPEAMRHGLEFAYGWIPAGAAIAAVVLMWRLSKRTDGLTAQRQVELAGIVALTVYAATSYSAFFPHAPYEQIAVYAMPLAAIFMVRLHLGTFARNGPAYALGVVWLAFLASAGLGLTIKDARLDAATVHGAGGSLAETRNEAALYQSALGWIERTTSPGEPIFVAPLMPALYTLSERTNPTEQLSVLPGSFDGLGGGADDSGPRGSRNSARHHRRSGLARLRPRSFWRYVRPNPRGLDLTSLRTRCRASIARLALIRGQYSTEAALHLAQAALTVNGAAHS